MTIAEACTAVATVGAGRGGHVLTKVGGASVPGILPLGAATVMTENDHNDTQHSTDTQNY